MSSILQRIVARACALRHSRCIRRCAPTPIPPEPSPSCRSSRPAPASTSPCGSMPTSFAGVRQAGRGRERAGQRRPHRHRHAEGRPRRRLHHDRRNQRGDGDPPDLAQDRALRSAEGLRTDRALREVAIHPGVNPALPIHSVPELIQYVKERPGQLSYSSSGVGGAPHLSSEYMKQRFDIDLAHVPYRNSPQSIADVAAGHVAMDFARQVRPRSHPLRQLRALAVPSSSRCRPCPSCRRSAKRSARRTSRRCRGTCCWRRPAPAGVVAKLHAEMKRIMKPPTCTRNHRHRAYSAGYRLGRAVPRLHQGRRRKVGRPRPQARAGSVAMRR